MSPLWLLALASVSGETISAFDYPSDHQARSDWTASEGTPPVQVSDTARGKSLRVVAPMASNPELRRAVMTHEVVAARRLLRQRNGVSSPRGA